TCSGSDATVSTPGTACSPAEKQPASADQKEHIKSNQTDQPPIPYALLCSGRCGSRGTRSGRLWRLLCLRSGHRTPRDKTSDRRSCIGDLRQRQTSAAVSVGCSELLLDPHD